VVGHEVLETRLDALVGSRLGIGDVAGDVLQGKRLGAQTGHRGRKSVEDTHDCSPLGSERPSGASTGAQAAILAKPFASSVPELIFRYFNRLPSRQPRRAGLGGKILQAWRQKMPGAAGVPAARQAGGGASAAGVNLSDSPFMQ